MTHQAIEAGGGNAGEGQTVSEDEAPAVVSAVNNNFFHNDDFRRLFLRIVGTDTVMKMRVLNKAWRRVGDNFIDGKVESGVMVVVGGNDLSKEDIVDLTERRALVTQVVFLLNITKVVDYACWYAINLVVVEIPEGVEYIGSRAFYGCSSLTTVSFPTTLKSICGAAFENCSSLENVDLFHTQLRELGSFAFDCCEELKSMTIPDSLQTLGEYVFADCSKLVPSTIDTKNIENDKAVTVEVVHYLRTTQVEIVKLKLQLAENDKVVAALKSKTNELTKTNAEQANMNAELVKIITKQATTIDKQATAIANLTAK
ncbi:hypothetical protein TrST_g2971 [Triparma strigata]|uniref:Leucine-rich repeat domain-containing protein n=2 Tax=Triparma TaxID=722752 RepID=A0A9W7A1F1_9STRA|nr:hypothetical protein TrST_g2971 [Triparma strigata]